MAGGGAASLGRTMCVSRDRSGRSGRRPFVLQGFADRARASRRRPVFPVILSLAGVATGVLSRLLRHGAWSWRPDLDARASSLGETDRDRLLGRPRPVLAFANVVELLPNELTRLGGRGLALALRLAGTLQGFLLRHDPSDTAWAARRRTGAASVVPGSFTRYTHAIRATTSDRSAGKGRENVHSTVACFPGRARHGSMQGQPIREAVSGRNDRRRREPVPSGTCSGT